MTVDPARSRRPEVMIMLCSRLRGGNGGVGGRGRRGAGKRIGGGNYAGVGGDFLDEGGVGGDDGGGVRSRGGGGQGRGVREVRGEPLPESLTRPLLDALRCLEWPTHRERGNVTATRYLTLSRSDFDRPMDRCTQATQAPAAAQAIQAPAAAEALNVTNEGSQTKKQRNGNKQDGPKLNKLLHKRARYRHLWELASAVMAWADLPTLPTLPTLPPPPPPPPLLSSGNAGVGNTGARQDALQPDETSLSPSSPLKSRWSWDGLAVSLNFVGSPHIDTHDVADQFALSLGDFHAEDGGELCVESAPGEVTQINTRGRLAKVGWANR